MNSYSKVMAALLVATISVQMQGMATLRARLATYANTARALISPTLSAMKLSFFSLSQRSFFKSLGSNSAINKIASNIWPRKTAMFGFAGISLATAATAATAIPTSIKNECGKTEFQKCSYSPSSVQELNAQAEIVEANSSVPSENKFVQYEIIYKKDTMSALITFKGKRSDGGDIKLSIVSGDINKNANITKQGDAQIIVNAANSTLLGGAGVDGCIHDAAGPRLVSYIREKYKASNNIRCNVADVKPTPSFDLKNNGVYHILHAVGPRVEDFVGQQGKPSEENKQHLIKCYSNILSVAKDVSHDKDLAQVTNPIIAIPSISTGIYGYPVQEASIVAVNTIANQINSKSSNYSFKEIRIVVYPDNFKYYVAALQQYCKNNNIPC